MKPMVRDLIALALPGLALLHRFSFNCHRRRMSREAAMHDALGVATLVATGEMIAIIVVMIVT
jgi:hypothetical protein